MVLGVVQEIKGIPYNKLNIGVPKEIWTNEKRVAITPAATAMLVKKVILELYN